MSYYYKEIEPPKDPEKSIKFMGEQLKIYSAFTKAVVALGMEVMPRLVLVEKTDKANESVSTHEHPINGAYHPASNRVVINLKADDPVGTVFHEVYHAYLEAKKIKLSAGEEERRCDMFAAEMKANQGETYSDYQHDRYHEGNAAYYQALAWQQAEQKRKQQEAALLHWYRRGR
jgi:hypothetical protein